MELRQAETLGVLDDHNRGIGNVDADLDDGGSDENPQLAVAKLAHDVVALVRFHAAMDQADAKVFEQSLAHFFRHLGGVA